MCLRRRRRRSRKISSEHICSPCLRRWECEWKRSQPSASPWSSAEVGMKSIVGKWPDPVVLWGAGYTGVAEKREAETDILAVIKVFTDMLANDVLAVQGQEQLV